MTEHCVIFHNKKWPEARSFGLLNIICYSEFELNGEFVNVQTFTCNSFGTGEKKNIVRVLILLYIWIHDKILLFKHKVQMFTSKPCIILIKTQSHAFEPLLSSTSESYKTKFQN